MTRVARGGILWIWDGVHWNVLLFDILEENDNGILSYLNFLHFVDVEDGGEVGLIVGAISEASLIDANCLSK
jgi:hypothetical protein